MSKGPSQVGTKTTTAIDPLRQAQAPYLAGGWESAQNLLQQAPQTPFPGSQYAEPYPQQIEGYGNLYNAGVNATPLNQAAYNPFFASTSGQYGVARDAYNTVRFKPVTTSALRLELVMQPGVSAGVQEWKVK